MVEEDKIIIGKNRFSDINVNRLYSIATNYNIYKKSLEENYELKIEMTKYCKDVHFLLWFINELDKKIKDKNNE